MGSPSGCSLYLYLQQEFQLSPTPRETQGQHVWLQPNFSITASILVNRVCETLCAFFAGQSLFPTALCLSLMCKACLFLDSDILGLIFPLKDSEALEPNVGLQIPLLPGGKPLQLWFFSHLGIVIWTCRLLIIASPPIILILLWFLPYSFSCWKSFQVVLTDSWSVHSCSFGVLIEKVSSESSQFPTILPTPLKGVLQKVFVTIFFENWMASPLLSGPQSSKLSSFPVQLYFEL